MIKSFYIAAMTMAIVMMAAVAIAGMVDIGLGRMDRTEFETLQQIVNGDFQPTPRVSAGEPAQRRIAEFNESDVDEIRLAMGNGSGQHTATAIASVERMVDIGTGSMAAGDFCDLNKLVANNNTNNQNSGFAFICP